MSKPKIMLIDDSELVLDVVAATLRDAGFDVVTRSLPVGAGAQIVRERPDLVLLDVSMPLMSGGEIARTVRASSLGQSACIVLHSDRPERELEELVQATGADGYLRKGSDPRRLVADVQAWLERARSMRRGKQGGGYALVVCGPKTRSLLIDALEVRIAVRYSDSGAEALRHVNSAKPPSLLLVGSSLADVSAEALYRAARQSDSSWDRRLIVIEEPGAPVRGELLDVPRWSTHEPVTTLATLVARLASTN